MSRAERKARGATFDNSIMSGYSSYDESYVKERPANNLLRIRAYSEDYQPYSDSERADGILDEFGEGHFKVAIGKATGRLRKKNASRVKGGVFQERKMKRRVYARCIGREIDTDRFGVSYNSLIVIFLKVPLSQLTGAPAKFAIRQIAVECEMVRRHVHRHPTRLSRQLGPHCSGGAE